MRSAVEWQFGMKAAGALFALAVSVCSIAAVSPAGAHGAIAAGVPDDVAQSGVAMGTGYNYDTPEGAKLRALEECLKFMDAPPETRALCKVVASFNKQCYSIALDPKEGTPGMGWAVASTKDEADRWALTKCKATSSADREQYCQISAAHCDGK